MCAELGICGSQIAPPAGRLHNASQFWWPLCSALADLSPPTRPAGSCSLTCILTQPCAHFSKLVPVLPVQPQQNVQAATLLTALSDECRSPATKAARHAVPSPRPLTENSPRRLTLLRAASSPAAPTLGVLRGQATSSGLTSPVPATSLAQAFASPVAPLPPRHAAQPAAMAMAADAASWALASADRPGGVSMSGSVCAVWLAAQPAPPASAGAEVHAAAEAGAADKQQASAVALSAAAMEAGHAAAAAAQLEVALAPSAAAAQVEAALAPSAAAAQVEAALAPSAAAAQVKAALARAGTGAGSDPSSASEVEAETAAAAAEASEGLLQLLAAGEQLRGEEEGMTVHGTQPSPDGLAGAAAAAGRPPAGGLQAGHGARLVNSKPGRLPSSFYRQLSVEEPAVPEPALLDSAPPVIGLPEDIEWHMSELLRTDPKTQEAVR